jgi:hypothetical protein
MSGILYTTHTTCIISRTGQIVFHVEERLWRSQGNITRVLYSLGMRMAFPMKHKTRFMQPWYVIHILGNIKHHLPGTTVIQFALCIV